MSDNRYEVRLNYLVTIVSKFLEHTFPAHFTLLAGAPDSGVSEKAKIDVTLQGNRHNFYSRASCAHVVVVVAVSISE